MTAHQQSADGGGSTPDDDPAHQLHGAVGMTLGRTVVFISTLYFLSLLVQAMSCCRSSGRGGRFARLTERSREALWRLEYGGRGGRTDG